MAQPCNSNDGRCPCYSPPSLALLTEVAVRVGAAAASKPHVDVVSAGRQGKKPPVLTQRERDIAKREEGSATWIRIS